MLALNWIRYQDGQAPERILIVPSLLENVITHAVATADDHSVTLTWANGATTVSQFSHIVGKGVFAPIADPAAFVQVRVGPRGRSLEWPGEIEFCADALWFEAHPEDTPKQSTVHREPA